MTQDGLKMYSATYDTAYHYDNTTKHLDYKKYIAAASLDAAICIALEILWNEFAKAPSLATPTDIHYRIEYEVTKALLAPNEGIASTTIWAFAKPQWTTTLEMVAPQPRTAVYVNATETHYVPLRYAPGEMIEDEERVRFLEIMRGEKPWIEPEEPEGQQNCSQQALFETEHQEKPA